MNITIFRETKKLFNEINEALGCCCLLALRQSLPREKRVFMTGASLDAAKNGVMIEVDPKEKITWTRRTLNQKHKVARRSQNPKHLWR